MTVTVAAVGVVVDVGTEAVIDVGAEVETQIGAGFGPVSGTRDWNSQRP